MTSLRVFPSERLICVFPACAEAHCVLGFPYRCVCSGSRLTVKAGAGAFFFLSAPASIQLYRGGAQRSAFTPRRADTHTRIYSHSLLPPTDSVLIYRWNATDSRPWTVLAAAEARSAPGSAHTRTAVLSPVGLTVRAALSFTRCHHTFTTRYIYVLPLWEGGQKLL